MPWTRHETVNGGESAWTRELAKRTGDALGGSDSNALHACVTGKTRASASRSECVRENASENGQARENGSASACVEAGGLMSWTVRVPTIRLRGYLRLRPSARLAPNGRSCDSFLIQEVRKLTRHDACDWTK